MGVETEVRERQKDSQQLQDDIQSRETDATKDKPPLRWYEFEQPLVWRNIIIMVYLHVSVFYGIYRSPEAKWQTWVTFILYYLFSGLGVTAGAHRLWTHRTYKACTPLQVMLMLFNCISFQNDILVWSRDHRVHHRFTETTADPHNAKRGFFFAHVGWLLMRKHPDVSEKGKSVDISDLLNDPIVQFQHRYFVPLGLLFSAVIPTFVPWYFWKEKAMVSFLLCVIVRYVLSLHVTWLVNSAAHLWGARPYDKAMNPAENVFVSIGAIGEGFHNYHHAFPHDYSTSEHGPYLNLTTCFIDLWAVLGLASDRRKMTSKMVEARRERTGVPLNH